jgi:hypothetical protein
MEKHTNRIPAKQFYCNVVEQLEGLVNDTQLSSLPPVIYEFIEWLLLNYQSDIMELTPNWPRHNGIVITADTWSRYIIRFTDDGVILRNDFDQVERLVRVVTLPNLKRQWRAVFSEKDSYYTNTWGSPELKELLADVRTIIQQRINKHD